MKRFIECILLTLILVSCGTDGDHFKIKGRLRNLNQGEFYVYSTDGGTNQLDTIKVQNGEFAYEVPLQKKATFILVFPNFSEQPVFGEPGKTASIQGDASHLKEIEVSGNKDNELMTDFRKEILHNSDKEIRKNIANFVNDHPESIVGIYLVNKYFIRTTNPDYKKALSLIRILAKAQPENSHLIKIERDLKGEANNNIGITIPNFSAISTNGTRLSASALRGKITVINVWATWNFESMGIQRQLQSLKKQYSNKLELIGINIDASRKLCTDALKNDSIKWNNVCDEQMWDSPLLKTLSLGTIPDNIIVGKDGKIIARGLNNGEIGSRLQTLLK